MQQRVTTIPVQSKMTPTKKTVHTHSFVKMAVVPTVLQLTTPGMTVRLQLSLLALQQVQRLIPVQLKAAAVLTQKKSHSSTITILIPPLSVLLRMTMAHGQTVSTSIPVQTVATVQRKKPQRELTIQSSKKLSGLLKSLRKMISSLQML